ncbi:MAG: SpoIID/LytB domain-containing protein [Clostridia bacterium]|nr:SpoIID/LytB domain-containing protein [Clostridia bacterium]
MLTVLNTTTGKVETIPLEDFVLRALAAEMTAYADSMEALKAQAVAIRSYVLAKSKTVYKSHKGAQICDDYGHCMACKTPKEYSKMYEVYRTRYEQAVRETAGQVLTYKGEIAFTYFHWCSYNKTESYSDGMGGGKDIPYLVPVDSPVTSGFDMVQRKSYQSQKLLEKLFGKTQAAKLIASNALPLGNLTKTAGGNVSEVEIYGVTVKASAIRSALSLKSTDFTLSYDFETDTFVFVVLGSGHGVGLSQEGARAYSQQGKSYTWILHHYYPGTILTTYTKD